MHNLGLGDLEFDPGHTVDQHRPDGFKVPDIDVEEETNGHTKHTEITNGSVSTKMKEEHNDSKSNEGKLQTTIADKKTSSNETEYLGGITWKSDDFEDASFTSLHNPKHVHHKPHSHGKWFDAFMESIIVCFIVELQRFCKELHNKLLYVLTKFCGGILPRCKKLIVLLTKVLILATTELFILTSTIKRNNYIICYLVLSCGVTTLTKIIIFIESNNSFVLGLELLLSLNVIFKQKLR